MSSPPGLPPLFAQTPVDLVPASPIAEFPVNTFLESIAVDAAGSLFITDHYGGQVLRIAPGNSPVVHAVIEGKATGLALTPDGSLLLSGWTTANLPVVFQIAPTGEAEILVELPEAIFLNGMTYLAADRYLIADSYRGAIWQLNLANRSVEIWLEHPLLARSSSDSELPAVNGLKRFGDFLYASNTEKQLLVKIPILATGEAGLPEIFVEQVNLDDFAFDQAGNLYGTTHIFNSVVRIGPAGNVTTIAEAAQGMAGSTALAFGRGPADQTSVYVVTNGGMSFPLPTGIESGKVVRLDVGMPGLELIL